tara:strand:+ start:409 stop:915 length:507 start_codon:yes stop_codon:yes gene_type:complete
MTNKQIKAFLSKVNNNGIETLYVDTKHIHVSKEFYNGKLMVLTTTKDLSLEHFFLSQGSLGSVWLPQDFEHVDQLINTIKSGSVWFDRITLHSEIKKLKLNQLESIYQYGLTKREVDITKQVIKGMSNKEIADHKYISETTVKTHLKNILSKVNVKNRTALVHKLTMQ